MSLTGGGEEEEEAEKKAQAWRWRRWEHGAKDAYVRVQKVHLRCSRPERQGGFCAVRNMACK